MTELVVAGMLMFSQRDSNMPEALGARIRGDLWTLTSTPGAGGLSVDPTAPRPAKTCTPSSPKATENVSGLLRNFRIASRRAGERLISATVARPARAESLAP